MFKGGMKREEERERESWWSSPDQDRQEALAGWGRCWRQGAAIKAEIWERRCHQQGTRTFHLSVPIHHLPHAPHPNPQVCLLYKPSIAAKQVERGFKRRRDCVWVLFHLRPKAHRSPFWKDDGAVSFFRLQFWAHLVNQNRTKTTYTWRAANAPTSCQQLA